MWFIISSEGVHTYLELNSGLTFGRRNANIELENDCSVSKKHASIVIKEDKCKNSTTCEIIDLESKYGTYISTEGQEFVRKTNSYLQHNDKIRLGLQNHIFTVHYMPLVTLTSTISKNDSEKLETLLDAIGGVLSKKMDALCTHLTVTCALLTEKVVWAMTSCVPIVTIAYWQRVRQAIVRGTKMPDVNNFVPALQESLINKDKVSLLPNEARRKLFNNLVFVFFSAIQFKVYGKMVHMAGGKSALFGKKELTFKDLCLPNAVVVQIPENYASQDCEELERKYEKIYEQMRAKSLRIVPDREIPLAILHCSIKYFCNPRHRYKLLCSDTHMPGLGETLVPKTQDIEHDVRPLPTVISNITIKPGGNRQGMNLIISETSDFLSCGVPETVEEPQPTIQKHSDHNLQAENEQSTSYIEKQSPNLKESAMSGESPIKANIKEEIVWPVDADFPVNENRKETVISDIIVKSGGNRQEMNVIISETSDFLSRGVPETVEEPQSTTQKHSDHNLQAENEQSISYIEKQSPNLKESAMSGESPTKANIKEEIVWPLDTDSPIKANIKEEIASPVDADSPPKRREVIPETLDTSFESFPVALSSEVCIPLRPKKLCVPEVHAETLTTPRARSPTSCARDNLTRDRLKINPACSQVNNKVVNWLAVRTDLTEGTSVSLRQSPEKSQPGLLPANGPPAKKRKNTLTDSINVEEYTSHMRNDLCFIKSEEKEDAPSPPNLRLYPVNKTFKKAKVLIPAQRISTKGMRSSIPSPPSIIID